MAAGLTRRAKDVADDQGFGALRGTYPVNGRNDLSVTIGSGLVWVAAVVFLVMARSAWSTDGPTAALLPGVAGLVFAGLGVYAAPFLLATLRGDTGARVYVFDRGAIAERPRGDLYSWPFTRATVRYVVWEQSWEGERRDRHQLWITFSDGDRICIDGLDPSDRAAMLDVAAALGANAEPERLGPRRPAEQPAPF